MAERWHYADQKKTDAPITQAKLHELASTGRLKPTDLVRKKGMDRWVSAAKVAGLFPEAPGKWYYTHWGKQFGPVSGKLLRRLAKVGMLEPTDLVWREGFDGWKKARRLIGLFSPSRLARDMTTVPDSLARTANSSGTSLKKPARRGRGGPHPVKRKDPSPARSNLKVASATRDRGLSRTRRRELWFIGLASLLMTAGLGGTVLHSRIHARPGPTARVDVHQTQTPTGGAVTPTPPIKRPDLDEPVQPIVRAPTRGGSTIELDSRVRRLPDEHLDEQKLGRLIHERLLKHCRIVSSTTLQARVENAAAPLLKVRERADVGYHFIVLDSDAVNAFSHLGGYVYLSRGLFNLIANEVELAWVVGHEIAHVDLKHGLATSLAAIDAAGQDPAERHFGRILAVHSNENEYAADAWTARRLLKLGYTRRQCFTFLKRYRSFLEQNLHAADGEAMAPSSDLAPASAAVDRHWLTMPSPEMRLNQLEKLDLSAL